MLFCGLNNIQNKCNFSHARVSANRNYSCHPVQSVITNQLCDYRLNWMLLSLISNLITL